MLRERIQHINIVVRFQYNLGKNSVLILDLGWAAPFRDDGVLYHRTS